VIQSNRASSPSRHACEDSPTENCARVRLALFIRVREHPSAALNHAGHCRRAIRGCRIEDDRPRDRRLPEVTLVRILDDRPGRHLRPRCQMQSECKNRETLSALSCQPGHLTASDSTAEWPVPALSYRRTQKSAASRKRAIRCCSGNCFGRRLDPRGPDWAKEQGVKSFAAQPLVFRGEVPRSCRRVVSM